MHLLLTDQLACPRCGPEFGLILLADVLEDRRVLEGTLGCSNCREQYPVHGGTGDLRPPPRTAPAAEEEAREETEPDEEDTLRVAALLGIRKGPGFALLDGPAARHAGALAGMIEDLEVVAASRGRGGLGSAPKGVSRILAGTTFPFFSGTLRGVVLSSGEEDRVDEAARVVAPVGRVVVLGAAPDTGDRLAGRGFEVLLEEAEVVVAVRQSR